MWISPEQLVTEYIERLIHNPGALQIVDFADGRVRLVGMLARKGGLLVGQQLRTLRDHMPNAEARIAAIYRNGRVIDAEGETTIEENDEIFFVAARDNIKRMMSELRRAEASVKKVVIAGGGNIGLRLARLLEKHYQVKLIERDAKRARRVAEQLEGTIVLQGDAQDEELLIEENIDSTDVFAAVTNSEEANVLSAMLAKRLGAHKVLALVNKPSYGELMENRSIDIAVSPQTVTIGSLLAHVRRGDVVRVHSLRRGSAEAMETVVHGPQDRSRVVGRQHRESGSSAWRADRGARPRRARDHRASRHPDRNRRPRHPVPDRPPPGRCRAAPVPVRLIPPGDALDPCRHQRAGRAARALRGVLPAADRHCADLRRNGAAAHLRVSAEASRLLCGGALLLATRRFRAELKPRDGYLLVSLSWLTLTAAAAAPFMIGAPHLSLTDAYFEAMSGLSTTGSTVISGIDALPHSVNMWRHSLHWLGGMGIIVLAVAILPLLGVGGMQMYRAECPGPVKDAKLTPRITETAKALWFVYAGLTAVCFLMLLLAGMPPFDALCHAFSVLALGGFSTHDASVGYFASPLIEAVLMVFMLVAAVNFSTHFVALRRGSPACVPSRSRGALDAAVDRRQRSAGRDRCLQGRDLSRRWAKPCVMRHSATISMATTTGFVTQDYCAVAPVRPDVDTVPQLHHLQHGFDGRRHQAVPHAGADQAVTARDVPAGAPAGHPAAEDRGPGGAEPHRLFGARLHLRLLHDRGRADVRNAVHGCGFHHRVHSRDLVHQQRGTRPGSRRPVDSLRAR